MAVHRYRSIEDVPPPWRDPDDPGNLRVVALMLALYRRFAGERDPGEPRVQRFRSLAEAQAAREDPYRKG